MKKNIKWVDFVIVAAATLIVAGAFFCTDLWGIRSRSFGKPDASAANMYLHITAKSGKYIYSLDQDGTYSIQGKNGISTIQIKDGKACFIDSECPNKTCVGQGEISLAEQWVSCMPNGVFIKITKGSKNTNLPPGTDSGQVLELDAVAQ